MKVMIPVIAIVLGVAARGDTLFPLPSVPDVTDGDGWAVGVGAGFEYEAEYDGSDDYGVEIEPTFIVQKRSGNGVWFLEGQELGWRGRFGDRWLLSAGLRFEPGREESEAPELDGLGDTDDEVMVMAEVRRTLAGDWNNWIAGRAMAGGSDIGALGVLAAGHTFAAREAGMGVDLFAFVTFGSSDFVNRDFGVTDAQSAASGLPATDLDGGYRSAGIQAIGRWRFGDRWQVQAEVGYEKYNSDIGDSPIALDDYEAEVGASVVYRFGF